MTELLIAFVGMLLLMTLMAVGVIFGRKPITGSCGGLSALQNGETCGICGATKAETARTPRADRANDGRPATSDRPFGTDG